MPSAGRPDSWIIISGSTGGRNSGATTATGSDDSLSEFASETTPKAIGAPGASIAARGRVNFVTVSATHILKSAVNADTATRLPTGSHTLEQRALRLVASLATRVRRLRASSTKAIRVPLWMGRVRDHLNRLGTKTTLTSFAGGIAIGALVMWFVSARPPMPVVPSTTLAVTPKATPPPDVPASPPDVQVASTTLRPVGTSGRSTGGLNQAVRPPRVATARSARTRNAAGAPPAYRGSLAFRSAPQGARVFVNGALVGSTPLVLKNLPVGSRAVRIEADGYQRWSASTQVIANRQTSVSATLGRAVQ